MLKRCNRISLCLLSLLLFTVTSFAQSAASRYVELYKEDAIKKMNEYGIPASIILGVAMHESGAGTSKISRFLNNHFGMKGKNASKKINSSYKGYDSVSQSYDDFISLLKKRTQFNKLFGLYSDHDYKSWARGIQKGGYAHSRTWSSQVLAIINKYQLYQYDNHETKSEIPDMIRAPEPAKEPAAVAVLAEKKEQEESRIYKVRRGDNLGSIAKKFSTSVKTIRTKNGLRSATLQVGQRLTL